MHLGHQKKSRSIRHIPKIHQAPARILRPTTRAHEPRDVKPEPKETAMFKPTTVLDLPSDMLEIGLIAFASPEFAERFVESLLADTAARTPHDDETGPNPMIAA
jgi:hypothetical protein